MIKIFKKLANAHIEKKHNQQLSRLYKKVKDSSTDSKQSVLELLSYQDTSVFCWLMKYAESNDLQYDKSLFIFESLMMFELSHEKILKILENMLEICRINNLLDKEEEIVHQQIYYYNKLNDKFNKDVAIFSLAIINIKKQQFKVSELLLDKLLIDTPLVNFGTKVRDYFLLYCLCKIINTNFSIDLYKCRKKLVDRFSISTYLSTYHEYDFILNIVSSIEARDIVHYTHEIHKYLDYHLSISKYKAIYSKLFILIHTKIMKYSKLSFD